MRPVEPPCCLQNRLPDGGAIRVADRGEHGGKSGGHLGAGEPNHCGAVG